MVALIVCIHFGRIVPRPGNSYTKVRRIVPRPGNSYTKVRKKPTIILEAACDYHTWFWHASYGYPGSLNDINIWDMSPLLESFISGKFHDIESTVCPVTVGNEELKEMFFLVDGIYPRLSRFIKQYPQPSNNKEKKYTKWHESVRKDIEQAFGILQLQFQFMCRPINIIDMKLIGPHVSSCLILHNMLVSDRVMEDVYATINHHI